MFCAWPVSFEQRTAKCVSRALWCSFARICPFPNDKCLSEFFVLCVLSSHFLHVSCFLGTPFLLVSVLLGFSSFDTFPLSMERQGKSFAWSYFYSLLTCDRSIRVLMKVSVLHNLRFDFEKLRWDGVEFTCSVEFNTDMFRASFNHSTFPSTSVSAAFTKSEKPVGKRTFHFRKKCDNISVNH